MALKLNLIIHFGPRQAEYPLQYDLKQNEAKLKIQQILKAVNKFITNYNIFIKNYLNIWVITKNGKQNLFKIKKSQSDINLILNENGLFQLKIMLEDIEDKQNLLGFFHSYSEQYMRLSNNINKIIEQSKQQQKNRGQKSMRPIDIAYFFADPLVSVSKNKFVAQHQVSYQLQYDKFIELVKKEQFGNNFRIEMMVATKANIKKILIDGASILHFSCHGLRSGSIQIQSETSVGQLVNLQHRAFTNLLDIIRNNLPKLIIFNVCYSSSLAEMISNSQRIITIGYNHKALDTYCQQFTKQFYMELFKYRYSVRQLFHIIKDKIVKANPQQGNKLCIFPKEPFPHQEELGFFSNTQSKLNFVKKWTFSESMRQNDSLGVKSQIFNFIKQFLTRDERISYLFLKGQPYSGKSDFMKKTKIYVMNRKVFTQQFTVDLRNKQHIRMQSMLQLRLQKQDFILKKMGDLKEISKQRRINPLIIIDHTQKILMLQYGKFIEFIQTKIIKQLKYGKVVIISNNITPIIKQQAQLFSKAYCHIKNEPNIEYTEFQNFIQRYVSQDIKGPAKQMRDNGKQSHLKLVQAIKKSKSQQQLQQFCKKQVMSLDKQHSSINLGDIDDNLRLFQKKLESAQQCASIKIQDNDYIFLSTIFSEIKIQSQQHYTNQKCTLDQVSSQIKEITKEFQSFIKSIFKKIKKQKQFSYFMLSRIPILMHLSLKSAALLYIYKEFSFFQKHLLHSQKLYVLIFGFYIQELHKRSDLYLQVSQYHLKVLLTLYSFYTQNYSKIKYKQLEHHKSQEEKQQEYIYHRKAQIIIEQIEKQFSKSKLQNVINTLQSLIIINNMAQELHYNKIYGLFAHNQHSNRRNSQIFQQSNDQCFDPQQQTALIDQQHEKIIKYGKAFEDIFKYSKSKFSVLKQKTIELIEILLLKKIVFNFNQLQVISQKGQSFLSQNTSIYIKYYIKILEKMQKDNIFDKFDQNGLFRNYSCEAIKPLYQEYLKAYIDIYFNLSKIKQNLSKQYRLPIYYQLINLCQKSHNITGITSIKKMIELHINEQFFNTWTCPTFVSLPLVYQKGGSNIKYNIKRFQNHVYNFMKHFYQNQIDKQVKFQFHNMGEQLLYEQQQEKRHLIQLIICDCVNDSQKIYLQDNTCKSKATPIRSIHFPKAPLTIYFGKSVSAIEQLYKQNHSIVIWINIDRKDRDIEDILQRQKTLTNIELYNNKFGIYYNILQYFYCSFCRHFFNGTHSLFIQQVKSSYDLAKAQTLIKTKILYSSSKEFCNEKQIETAIGQIDSNLQYISSSRYGKQLKKIPAYHFISKQKKVLKQNQSHLPLRTWEIGCNHQIHQLLLELNKIKLQKDKSVNFIIYYKSSIMLLFFINTLRIKLLKINKFTLNPEVNSNNYSQYRKKIQKDINQPKQTGLPIVTPFINLRQNQIIEELNTNSSMVKLFFAQKSYGSIQNKKISLMSIKQGYKTNKVEFQLYYLCCKSRKTNVAQKKLMNSFKQIANNPSSSLQDIKKSIQRL